VLPGMDGYFRTRKLDACEHGIVDAVLAHAKRRADRGGPSPRSKHPLAVSEISSGFHASP